MVAKSGRIQFGVPTKGRTTRTSDRGRVCRADGCATVLSIYNDSSDCSVHEITKVKPIRDR
jgi:hypothetical protein